jgi:hypothetical protein
VGAELERDGHLFEEDDEELAARAVQLDDGLVGVDAAEGGGLDVGPRGVLSVFGVGVCVGLVLDGGRGFSHDLRQGTVAITAASVADRADELEKQMAQRASTYGERDNGFEVAGRVS